MAAFVKVADKVINLDAVAYFEPDQCGTYRVYFLGPDTGGGGGMAYLVLKRHDVADLLAAAGFGPKR